MMLLSACGNTNDKENGGGTEGGGSGSGSGSIVYRTTLPTDTEMAYACIQSYSSITTTNLGFPSITVKHVEVLSESTADEGKGVNIIYTGGTEADFDKIVKIMFEKINACYDEDGGEQTASTTLTNKTINPYSFTGYYQVDEDTYIANVMYFSAQKTIGSFTFNVGDIVLSLSEDIDSTSGTGGGIVDPTYTWLTTTQQEALKVTGITQPTGTTIVYSLFIAIQNNASFELSGADLTTFNSYANYLFDTFNAKYASYSDATAKTTYTDSSLYKTIVNGDETTTYSFIATAKGTNYKVVFDINYTNNAQGTMNVSIEYTNTTNNDRKSWLTATELDDFGLAGLTAPSVTGSSITSVKITTEYGRSEIKKATINIENATKALFDTYTQKLFDDYGANVDNLNGNETTYDNMLSSNNGNTSFSFEAMYNFVFGGDMGELQVGFDETTKDFYMIIWYGPADSAYWFVKPTAPAITTALQSFNLPTNIKLTWHVQTDDVTLVKIGEDIYFDNTYSGSGTYFFKKTTGGYAQYTFETTWSFTENLTAGQANAKLLELGLLLFDSIPEGAEATGETIEVCGINGNKYFLSPAITFVFHPTITSILLKQSVYTSAYTTLTSISTTVTSFVDAGIDTIPQD